jgi:hypothetical protein
MRKLRRILKIAWIPMAAAFGPFAMVMPMLVGFTIPFPVGIAISIAGIVGVTALLQRLLHIEVELRKLQGKTPTFYGAEEGDDFPPFGAPKAKPQA